MKELEVPKKVKSHEKIYLPFEEGIRKLPNSFEIKETNFTALIKERRERIAQEILAVPEIERMQKAIEYFEGLLDEIPHCQRIIIAYFIENLTATQAGLAKYAGKNIQNINVQTKRLVDMKILYKKTEERTEGRSRGVYELSDQELQKYLIFRYNTEFHELLEDGLIDENDKYAITRYMECKNQEGKINAFLSSLKTEDIEKMGGPLKDIVTKLQKVDRKEIIKELKIEK